VTLGFSIELQPDRSPEFVGINPQIFIMVLQKMILEKGSIMGSRGRRSIDEEMSIAFIRQQTSDALLENASKEDIEYWKAQYDIANMADFKVDIGHRHYVHGPDARRRHYEHHNIPVALILEWDAARASTSKADGRSPLKRKRHG
jgi:hypothetical protein